MTPDLIARLRAYGRTDAGPKGEVLLNEAADRIEALEAEIARRDRNETRNCINWGPCSAHDGRMGDLS